LRVSEGILCWLLREGSVGGGEVVSCCWMGSVEDGEGVGCWVAHMGSVGDG
jgi:hypothetical protein